MGEQLAGRSQVLIVGAGPAGCAAAITLARAGVEVCVVDRARFPRPKTCGDALSNGGMALLDAMGAGARVRAEPHALVRHASVVFPNGRRVGRDYASPGYIIPRVRLDDALRRAAEAAGARVLEGIHVRRLLTDGQYQDPDQDPDKDQDQDQMQGRDGDRAQDRGRGQRRDKREGGGARGRVLGASGDRFHWQADVTIAADGPFSVGLAALGCARPRAAHVAVAATAYARGVAFPLGPHTADHYMEAELRSGYGWIFPEVDGRANFGVYQRSDAYDAGPGRLKAALDSFVARHPDRFAGATIEGRVHTWSLPLAAPPHAVAGPGLLLAGDAACLVDPLSGEGIWQAIFSGVEAAKSAAGAVAEGQLSARLRDRYTRVIRRRIGRPSHAKRAVQRALDGMVTARLYRWEPLLQGLRRAYAGGLLEITKRG